MRHAVAMNEDLHGRAVDDAAHRRADLSEGRAARKRAPRKGLGVWDPAARQAPAIERLRAQEPVRDQDLLPLRYARMASSPWAYLRGAAAVMASDLATRPHSGLTVQMCGDAHVLNFGLWASPERRLLFNVRDFDETLPGPFEWDLKRLGASVFVLANSVGLPESRSAAAVTAAVEGYCEAIGRYAEMGELEVWYDRIDADAVRDELAPDAIEKVERVVRKQARKRSQAGAVQQFTEVVNGRRRIIEELPKRQRVAPNSIGAAGGFEEVYSMYLASIPAHLERLISRFKRLDAVRQVVGVGSVGMRVWLLLMEGDSGVPVFFQIKQATHSVFEDVLEPSRFASHGERVVVGQRLMQSASDMFLGHLSAGGHDYYLRQFRDMKVIPDGDRIAGSLTEFSRLCGLALAKSHARSGEPGDIADYIGKGAAFSRSIVDFSRAYAAQTHADHADLVALAAAGGIEVAERPW